LAAFGSATVSVASVGVSPAEFVLRRTSSIAQQNEDIAKDWGGSGKEGKECQRNVFQGNVFEGCPLLILLTIIPLTNFLPLAAGVLINLSLGFTQMQIGSGRTID
jgi:hypothetical protein